TRRENRTNQRTNTSPNLPPQIYPFLLHIRTICVLSMSLKTRGASGGNHGVVYSNFLFLFIFISNSYTLQLIHFIHCENWRFRPLPHCFSNDFQFATVPHRDFFHFGIIFGFYINPTHSLFKGTLVFVAEMPSISAYFVKICWCDLSNNRPLALNANRE
ncbi:hypothetical protein H5410_026603, partial [Solanum commersonii]